MNDKNSMTEYLKWRGDLTFEQDPFNIVDNLILAQMAYIDYDGIVPETRENPVSISEVCRRYWEVHTEEEIRKRESFVKLSPFLLKPVAESRRFEKMRLSGYVNYLSKSSEAQMSAVQFELEDGTVYVAFRGTDETLIGWKEDFNLSYMSRTEGQKLAVEYMKRHFGDTDLRLRVGGHSKDGNFAVFASSFSGPEVSAQIQKVYSNDGPGFREEITSKPEYRQIMNRTINIIPQDSIIGRLLNAGRNAIVVRSNRKGIMQHDALSWEIMGNRFINTERSSDSIYLEKVLSGWLENVDDEARQIFVDQIFGILQTIGADTVKDMKEISIRDLTDAVQMVRGLSKDQQTEMSDVLKKLVASGGKAFYEEMEQREGIIPDIFKKLTDLREKVSEARMTAESVKLGVQAAAGILPEKKSSDIGDTLDARMTEAVENAARAAEEADEKDAENTAHKPAEETEDPAEMPSVEQSARKALEEGIEIEGSRADDRDGEDPQ